MYGVQRSCALTIVDATNLTDLRCLRPTASPLCKVYLHNFSNES